MRTGIENIFAIRCMRSGAFFGKLIKNVSLKMCNPCHMFKPSICILDFNHALRQLRPDSRLPAQHIPTVEPEDFGLAAYESPTESHRWRRIRCQCVCLRIQSLCIQNKLRSVHYPRWQLIYRSVDSGSSDKLI
jgi:hypothetical protein